MLTLSKVILSTSPIVFRKTLAMRPPENISWKKVDDLH